VRIEIEAALERNIRVIPLLLDEAAIPRSDDLPPSLSGLVRCNAFRISSSRFRDNAYRLFERLRLRSPQVRPQSAVTIDGLSLALRRAQDRARRKEPNSFIIVNVPPRPHSKYYIQFWCDADRVWGEAVSNAHIDDASSFLADEQVARLVEMGWEKPGDVPNFTIMAIRQ
jgi:hypothetical protein